MSLFEDWKNKFQDDENKQEYTEFIKKYYGMEEESYRTILESYPMVLSGKASDLAKTLGFAGEATIFMGFLDGINESLKTVLDLEPMTMESDIVLDIDYEKLYWNMHEAKADWLFNLKEWNNVIEETRRNEIAKQYRISKIVHNEKIGRNDACPCGSGKKYKNCCINKA
jgi:uncharacterized protein YecA (UPF0149 family)